MQVVEDRHKEASGLRGDGCSHNHHDYIPSFMHFILHNRVKRRQMHIPILGVLKRFIHTAERVFSLTLSSGYLNIED